MQKDFQLALIDAVRWTPTGDNAQPFTASWESETLIIRHNSNLAKHRLNFQNYASLISLGAALENVRVTAQQFGLTPNYTLNDEALEKTEITFRADSSLIQTDLHAAIKQRFTDRRLFEDGWNDSATQKITERTKDYSATPMFIQKLPQPVLKHLFKMDSFFWSDPRIFFDTAQWVRFSDAAARRTKDGMHVKNLGLDLAGHVVFWLASRHSIFQKIFYRLGCTLISRKVLKNQLLSAGGFVFFYPKKFSIVDTIETGKLAQRTWLELTALGFAAQPITMGVLLPYLSRHTSLLSSFKPREQKILEQGLITMDEQLKLPMWGLRWGQVSTPLPIEARTYRRDI